MSLTVLEGARLAGGAGTKLAIPWRQAAAAFAVVPPTAFLFAAVMVAIGALARSFKEAQTLLTPVYFLCMAPALTAGLGDFRLSGVTAVIPGVGVTLLARDLVLARASVGLAVAVLASTALYGAAALLLASRLYDSERLFASDDGRVGLGTWVRQLVMGKRARRGDARPRRRSRRSGRHRRLRDCALWRRLRAAVLRLHPAPELAARAQPDRHRSRSGSAG